jgi:hypothetical protein
MCADHGVERSHSGLAMIEHMIIVSIAIAVLAARAAPAQNPPVIRQIGRLERITSDSLASVATVVPMSDGRVLVNDITARRLLLFDSTLSHPIVVADTTSATVNAYGKEAGTLIRYRADTALYIDIGSLSMLVIGPGGKIERVMAVPRADEAQYLIGSVFGTPGFDGRGRLTYYSGDPGGIPIRCCLDRSRMPGPGSRDRGEQQPDSAFIIRVDLATRAVDTATSFKIPKVKVSFKGDADGFMRSVQITENPFPVVDDWAVCPDGSIAVVRGRDYHVDWLSSDGRWATYPKMPFDWQRVSDARKQAIIDSAVKSEEEKLEKVNATLLAARTGGAGDGAGRGGRSGGGSGGGRGGGLPIPLVAGRLELTDVADYAPAFTQGSVSGAADGTLWIRTTAMVRGQPVYDVVNRRGEVVDRVQLPSFRTIAGFGPGVIYMAVKDSAGVVRLERARVR